MTELKQTTHCWIDVILFGSLGLSLFDIKSLSVNSGAPSLLGSSSLSSTNSPFQIFSASFLGTGGEWIPTGTASLDEGAGSGGSRLARGVISWSPEPCSTVAGLPRLMIGVRLLLLAGPAVGTADITGMPGRAVVGGNRPPLGMLATPPLPTGNVPLGVVLVGAV